MAKWWYNTNKHASTKLTPFEVVYGYSPLPLLAHTSGTSSMQSMEEALRSRDLILRRLWKNLHIAHERMKRFADLKRTERSFEVGDMVYLHLQPYKQQSVVQCRI